MFLLFFLENYKGDTRQSSSWPQVRVQGKQMKFASCRQMKEAHSCALD